PRQNRSSMSPYAPIPYLFALLAVISPSKRLQTGPETPAKLTVAAADRVKQMFKDNHLDPAKAYLRIAVKHKAAREYPYAMNVTEDPRAAADLSFESRGVPICIDPKSALYLTGATVDYREV